MSHNPPQPIPRRRRRDRFRASLVLECLETRNLLACSLLGADLAEGNAADWGTFASDGRATSVGDDTTHVRVGKQALRFDTASGFDTGLQYPATPADSCDLSDRTDLDFWEYPVNDNPNGFQGNQPIIVLKGPAGSFRYEPREQMTADRVWTKVSVPLAGDGQWVRTTTGTPTLADITQLEIHHDTWDYGFTIFLDGAAFTTVVPTCSLREADLTEGNAADWGTFATDGRTAGVADDATRVKVGGQSLRFDTDSGFDTGVRYPATATDHCDLSDRNFFVFSEYAVNDNAAGFQGNQPVVVLNSPTGSFRYTPRDQMTFDRTWHKNYIPLAGDDEWVRTTTGTPSLADITQVEIHHDTWDYGFTIFIDGAAFVSLEPGRLPPEGPPPPDGVNPDAIEPKTLLYVFDPVSHVRGDLPLHQAYRWNDPVALTDQIVNDLRTHSHDLARFQVVETEVADAFPYLQDGFRYDDVSYDQAVRTGQYHDSLFDYNRFIADNHLAERIDRGELDEVWVYGAPGFGMWESTMAGNGGYWCNSPPVRGVPGERTFVIMGWNYERGVGEAIHSFGHRVESIMVHSYGAWLPNQANSWNKFTLLDKDRPGLGGVGNVHFPVNGQSDYDYANPRYVVSNADDWYNYPDFQGTTRTFNYTEWSPNRTDPQREYLNWWYDHMPHAPSRGYDYYLNNWWRYILDVDQFKGWNGNLYYSDGIPTAAVTGPADGDVVSGLVAVSANVQVDGALGRVDLYVDGEYYATDTLAPYTFWWDTTGLTGEHTLVAKAYELQNGTEGVSDPITVTIADAGTRAIRGKDRRPGLSAPALRGADAAVLAGRTEKTAVLPSRPLVLPPGNTGRTGADESAPAAPSRPGLTAHYSPKHPARLEEVMDRDRLDLIEGPGVTT